MTSFGRALRILTALLALVAALGGPLRALLVQAAAGNASHRDNVTLDLDDDASDDAPDQVHGPRFVGLSAPERVVTHDPTPVHPPREDVRTPSQPSHPPDPRPPRAHA